MEQSVVFLLSLSQMAFQSQPNDFSFGAENIFLSARRPDTLLAWVENVPETVWRCASEARFTLFGSFHWPKKDWQIVL